MTIAGSSIGANTIALTVNAACDQREDRRFGPHFDGARQLVRG